MTKVVQVSMVYDGDEHPRVVVLCKDGSLWTAFMYADGRRCDWGRVTLPPGCTVDDPMAHVVSMPAPPPIEGQPAIWRGDK